MLQTIKSRVSESSQYLPILKSMTGQKSISMRPFFMRQPTMECINSSQETETSPSWSTPVKYQPSPFARSRELGRLDPSLYLSETNEDLYDVPIDHLGRVWFTIAYNEAVEQLRIIIHKARNLRSPRYHSFRSASNVIAKDINSLSLLTPTPTLDCRIRVYIENSEKKFHTTSIKRQSNNPTFEESFTFQLPKHELANQKVRLEVLSIEKTKRTLLIGFIALPLAVLAQTEHLQKPIRMAKDLQLCDGSNVTGNILLVVSLTYFPLADRLTVGLFECHNLPLKATGLPISVYAKVIICHGIQGKMLKTKRTELLDQRESFNESFTFSKLSDPSSIHMRIVITQPGFFDKPVAILVLGSEMVTKGSGITHWNSMIERPEVTVTKCHELQLL